MAKNKHNHTVAAIGRIKKVAAFCGSVIGMGMLLNLTSTVIAPQYAARIVLWGWSAFFVFVVIYVALLVPWLKHKLEYWWLSKKWITIGCSLPLLAMVVSVSYTASLAILKRVQSAPQAPRIVVKRSYALKLKKRDTGQLGLATSVHFKNEGLSAVTAKSRCMLTATNGVLSWEAQESAAKQNLEVLLDVPLDDNDQMQPGDERFFSCPDSDDKTDSLSRQAAEIVAGTARLYLFVSMRYKDRNGATGITEFCNWYSGPDLDIGHFCGRNRILTDVPSESSGVR